MLNTVLFVAQTTDLVIYLFLPKTSTVTMRSIDDLEEIIHSVFVTMYEGYGMASILGKHSQ